MSICYKAKVLLIALLSVFSVGRLFADEKIEISGVVMSSLGEPLIGALVIVTQNEKGVMTDAKGEFKFSIEKGYYSIEASYLGYEKNVKNINFTHSQKLNFALKSSTTQIERVVIERESSQKRIEKTVYSVNAIDIASRVGSIQSLSQVIDNSVGVRLRRDGGVGSDYDLSLNGMGGDAIRYFIDGVPLDSRGEDFSLDNIPTNIVKQVEVYKGVVPAHLGGDALGGAINIITKENQQNFYDLSYGVGSFHTHRADFNAQIKAPKSGIVIKPTFSLSYSKNDYMMRDVRVLNPESNEFETGDYRRFNDDYKSIYGAIEAGVTGKRWADYLFVSGSITDIEKEIQTGATQDVVYGAAHRESSALNISTRYKKSNLFTQGLTLSLNASHTWDKSSTIDTALVQYYWNGYSKPASDAEINHYPVIRNYTRPLTTLRSNLDYKLFEGNSLNLNYLMTRLENQMTEEAQVEEDTMRPSDDVLTRHFIGLAYNLDLFDSRWHTSIFAKEYVNSVNIAAKDMGMYDPGYATVGYVYDGKKTTKYFTGYGAGTRFTFLDALALKASYEYSVRLPGSFELLGDGENVMPNFDLEPEKSNNYNFSLFGTIDLGKSKISYDVGGFYRDIHDFIMPVQRNETFTYQNVSEIQITGVEGELSYRYGKSLHLAGNITYENAVDMMEQKITDGKPNAAYRQKVPNRPSLYSNITASYTFHNIFSGRGNKLTFEYQYDYVKWFYLTWASYGAPYSKSYIPTQFNHNASATYSWGENRYSLSMSCNNIFDATLYDNYKLQKAGRAFYAKFRLFFN